MSAVVARRAHLIVGLVVAICASFLTVAAHATTPASLHGNAGQEGVRVEIYPVDSSQAVSTSTTGPDGSFAFDGLDAGAYHVRFSKRYSIPAWYGGTEERLSALPVDLASGTLHQLAPVTLSPGGTIRGVVTENGQPLSQPSLRFYTLTNGVWAQESPFITTGSTAGEYSRQLSTGGPVVISVTSKATVRRYAYFYGDAYSTGTAEPVEVGSGDTLDLDIDTPGSGRLQGKLTNAFGGPIGGLITVWIRDHGKLVELPSPSSVSVEGGFSILVPANAEVSVLGKLDRFTETFLGGSQSAESASLVSVPPGGVLEGLEIALPSGQAIQGTLVQKRRFFFVPNFPVASATVTAWWKDQLMSRSVTDDAGRFRLTGLRWSQAPAVTLRVEGTNLETRWIGNGGELFADQESAQLFRPGNVLHDSPVGRIGAEYTSAAQIHPTSELRLLSTVAGKPLRLQLPTWSIRPDAVEIYHAPNYQDAGKVATFAPDESGIVEIPTSSFRGAVTAVGTKAGLQSGTTQVEPNLVPFAATSRVPIKGAAVAGQTLEMSPPSFNAHPDRTTIRWVRSDGTVVRGARLRLRKGDAGGQVRAVVEAWYGTATYVATRHVQVRAKSVLTGSARRSSLTRSIVTLRLRTRGVTKPGGVVKVVAGTKVVGRVKVTRTPIARTLNVGVDVLSRKLYLVYPGTRKAAPARTALRIR